MNTGFHSHIFIHGKGSSRHNILNLNIFVMSIRRDPYNVVRRVRIHVIGYGFVNCKIGGCVKNKLLFNIRIKNNTSGIFFDPDGNLRLKCNVCQRLQSFYVRIALIESDDESAISHFKSIAGNCRRAFIVHNINIKACRTDIRSDQSLRQFIDQICFIIKLKIFLFAERKRKLIRFVRIYNIVSVLICRRIK